MVLTPRDGETVEPAASGQTRASAPRHEGGHRPTPEMPSLDAASAAPQRLVKDTLAAALFSVQSWYVAPPPPPPAPVVKQTPPPPSAPPLPFAFMGSYTAKDGAAVYFLTAGDRVYDVKVGDTLDESYSVDGVKSGQLLLTYLPLKIQQSLVVGEE